MSTAVMPLADTDKVVNDLRVVHSLPGRVRVHLPDWVDVGGELVARVGATAGVTSATVSALTGNILVYFDPEQLSEQALLSDLAAFCADTARSARQTLARPLVAAEPLLRLVEPAADSDAPVENLHQYVTGMWRRLYVAAGWASVGMAVVGAITPGIPTVPFVILAAYFFVRSSPEAHAWLQQSRWFGSILRNWEEHRGVTFPVKCGAVGFVLVAMLVTLAVGLPLWLMLTILAIQVLVLAFVLSLRVVRPSNENASLSVATTPLLSV